MRQFGSHGLLSFRTRIGLKQGPLVTAIGIETESDDTLFLPVNVIIKVPGNNYVNYMNCKFTTYIITNYIYYMYLYRRNFMMNDGCLQDKSIQQLHYTYKGLLTMQTK